MARPGEDEGRRVRVWDLVVRIGHWLLVATIAAAWLTQEGRRTLHENLGYVALVIVAVRVAWGFAGSEHARFADFVRGPRATLRYAAELLAGRARRHLGHNPLGGWMALVLLGLVAATGATGWLYTTDRYWGVEWVEELHDALSDALMIAVTLHVLGAIAMSWRHRENLVAAMVHGMKRLD
jgi:cytochrome b